MVFLQRTSASGIGRKRPAGLLPVPPRPLPAAAAEGSHPSPRTIPSSSNVASSSGRQTVAVPREGSDGGAAGAGEDFSVLASILADAGCTLCCPGPLSLPGDIHKLCRRLESRFERGEPVLDQFLSALSSYTGKPQNFRRILIPASRDVGGGKNGVSPRGESLARVLLLVAPLQPRLQHLLLEKLPEYFDTVVAAGQPSLSSSLDDDVARLIVNQFRWLDFVVDPVGLSEKLMEVLSICPPPLKREIIGSLPEIIGDYGSSGIVEALERMLQEDSDLVVPVLDAFSSLNLDKEHQEQVVTIALSCIRTVDAEYMPHLLRFLLVSANQGNVGRIISQIREQLRFVGMADPRASRSKQLKGKSVAGGTEALILEALRSSLRFKNILCEAILKELKCLNQPRDHKVIDVWLLMIVYTNGGSLQKSVEKIMKKKIIEHCLQESLFDRCIQGQRNLVKNYFQSFLSLAEYLLTCIEAQAREFGIHMFTSLFEEFTDTHSRQEVLGALVSRIGSGVNFEVSSALEAMLLLTSKYSHAFAPLSSHVNGILDYLEGFNNDNLQKVYEIFCHLAFCGHPDTASVGSFSKNELLMLVRKQVGNPDMRYRRMGIIGTLKIVSTLGDINASINSSSSQEANCEEALELLKVSFNSCKLATSSLILLYDELAALVDCTRLPPTIVEWMGTHLGDFESVFVTDLKGGHLLSKNLYFGLEGVHLPCKCFLHSFYYYQS
ncbi:hypothetical protein Taro_041249 [Colocasia esculenta]|uniref:Fanconi anemia group D2 protein n=1 Tax=Colocasia esculenta TaxID=4460 RepID=A0A843WB02_COLES|nr:hypothetical protein [Colocasia esculenta]